jgi:hypothetical protein
LKNLAPGEDSPTHAELKKQMNFESLKPNETTPPKLQSTSLHPDHIFLAEPPIKTRFS